LIELPDKTVRDWTRLGIYFAAEPASRTPDLERLLLDTAREVPKNPRLFNAVATWLSLYGNFIARHRLARLIHDELEPQHQPVLGLLLESAALLGAPRELAAVGKNCVRASPDRPLHAAYDNIELRRIAERHASDLSRRWGVLAPDVERRLKTIRPVTFLLQHNPAFRDRIIRKGDLRASIIETLRWDVPEAGAVSESELARLCGATRVAVRNALKSLQLEGAVVLNDARTNRRDNSVRLAA
jgi:hypothetical protein